MTENKILWLIIPIVLGTIVAAVAGVFDDFVAGYDYTDEINDLNARVEATEKETIKIDTQKDWAMNEIAKLIDLIKNNSDAVHHNAQSICKLSQGEICD